MIAATSRRRLAWLPTLAALSACAQDPVAPTDAQVAVDAPTVDALDSSMISDASDFDSPDAPAVADVSLDVRVDAPTDAAPQRVDRCPADRAALVEGVRTLISTGSLMSPLIVHGEDACPIAWDARSTVFMASARAGEGRVFVAGHETHLNRGPASAGDGGRLMLNVARWMTAGRTSPVVGVDSGQSDLRAMLTANGFTVRTATPDALAGLDVWVSTSYPERTPAQIAAIAAFVRAGGGLIMGGQAWSWAQTHENAAENYPGNKILNDLGITITSETDVMGGTNTVAPGAPPDALHAGRALDLLLAHATGTSLLSASDLDVAARTVGRAALSLPLASSYFERVRRFRAGVGEIVPTTARPVVPATQPIEALALRIDVRFARDLPVGQVLEHPAARDFPGAVPAGTPTVTTTITVNATHAGRDGRYFYANPRAQALRSTGLYAAPGASVTVTVDPTAVAAGLSLQIGAHTDTLWSLARWPRVPEIVRTYPLDRASVVAVSAFGGPVYVRVPVGATLGPVSLTVAGAVAAPRFVLGTTTAEQWRTTQRTLGAPWAEIEGAKLILSVPTSEARAVDDPGPLMTWWDRVLDADADLAVIPRTRARPERAVFDREISAGFLHSGYAIMGHLPSTEYLNLATLSTTGNWGLFHELGHNHQASDWTLPGTTEATVNLFSVYAMETVVGLAPRTGHPAITPTSRAAAIRAYITGGRNFTRDWSVWTALETYLQLQEAFGWALFTRLLTEYNALPEPMRPTTDSQRVQQWIVRSSLAAGRDLVPFYEGWGFPIEAATRTATMALPAWAENPMRL